MNLLRTYCEEKTSTELIDKEMTNEQQQTKARMKTKYPSVVAQYKDAFAKHLRQFATHLPSVTMFYETVKCQLIRK